MSDLLSLWLCNINATKTTWFVLIKIRERSLSWLNKPEFQNNISDVKVKPFILISFLKAFQRFKTRQNRFRMLLVKSCSGVNWPVSAQLKPANAITCDSVCQVHNGWFLNIRYNLQSQLVKSRVKLSGQLVEMTEFWMEERKGQLNLFKEQLCLYDLSLKIYWNKINKQTALCTMAGCLR